MEVGEGGKDQRLHKKFYGRLKGRGVCVCVCR